MAAKNTRKLTRGLSDISAFFLSGLLAPNSVTRELLFIADRVVSAPAESKENHEQPSEAEKEHAPATFPVDVQSRGASAHNTFPEVYCFAIHPFESHEQLLNRPVFFNAMKSIFSEVFFLSFSVNRLMDFSAQNSVRQLVLPPFQLYDVLHPKPVSAGELLPAVDSSKRVCFFLEPKSMFDFQTDLFQLLDRVILHVLADSPESILAAYQTLTACLQRDPTVRFSILIDGALTDDVSEMIYERFSEITSQFLGCEVDFLGWVDGENLQLNQDLLLNVSETETGALIRKPLKFQLTQLLAEEMLLEAV